MGANFDELSFFFADADGQVTKITNAKNSFFTSAIAHEICLKLINEYFVLTDRDLAFWDSDPEAYGICY